MYDLTDKRVWVAGHGGMVGSALMRRLADEHCTLLIADRDALDLRDQSAVDRWVAAERPQAIFLAAARVGGIQANSSRPVDFLYDNLMIEANIIAAAHRAEVEKLCFLGSSCIYPRDAAQPIAEDSLLTGALEPTNQWYAIAKITGIMLAQAYRKQHGDDFISVMPTNLYGPGDNYDPQSSHVLPALIRKAHLVKTGQADTLPLWGTGEPRREFLHADDCADACVFLMKTYSEAGHVNVGTGEDIRLVELARLVCEIVGVDARITFDPSKPDGTPRKLLDVEKIRGLGWAPKIGLKDGIRRTYADLVAQGVLADAAPVQAG